MGRTANLRIVDPILSALARGYIFPELACEKLFPIVRIDKEAGKLPQFGKEAFRIYQTERALRAKSNRINPEDYGSIDVVLTEHDLEYPIDYRERQESENVLPLERWATNVVTKALRIRCEKKCADLAQNPANYAAGNKLALVGGDKFSDKVNSDPLGVLDDGKDAVRQKIGVEPNTIVIGYQVWKKLKRHPQLVDLIKFSQKGVVSSSIFAEAVEIENVVIGRSAYDSEVAGAGLTDVWGNSIVMAYVPANGSGEERTEYEPSYGYTFGKKNQPVVDTYVEGGKVQIIRNTDIFEPYIVGAEGGYLIYDVV